MSEAYSRIVLASKGRDAGKSFRITERDVLEKASFVLRLVAALRVDSYEELLNRVQGAQGSQIDTIMHILQGAQPSEIHALITEALLSMQVAPDPKHPEAFRSVSASDVQELTTLGELLAAFASINVYA